MSTRQYRFCENCGARNAPTGKFCSQCSEPLDPPAQPTIPTYGNPGGFNQPSPFSQRDKLQVPDNRASQSRTIIISLSFLVIFLLISVGVLIGVVVTHQTNQTNSFVSSTATTQSNHIGPTPTPTQQPITPTPTPTQQPITPTPTTQALIGTQTGTFEGCPYSELHSAPNGTTWSPNVGNQPTSLEIWSNRTSDQTLYKVWLPQGFHTTDGKTIVFPGGGGEYDTFAAGCNVAAQDWFNKDGTQHTATIDELINTYHLATTA